MGDYPNPNPNTIATITQTIGPGVNPDGTLSGLMISGVYNPQNIKQILVALGIVLDGEYRENILPAGVFNYVEKYARTGGAAPDGLYCYNFCLNTSPYELQPSGAFPPVRKYFSIKLYFKPLV